MMYYSDRSYGESSVALGFTEHAAACFSELVSPLTDHHFFSNANSPLLNELNSFTYNRIEQLVKDTFPVCNIDKIRLVHSPQMYGMYKLRHEKMKLTSGQSVSERVLYHVTTESRAMESLDTGLDWRRTRRSKFGRGVSFSSDIDYANYYANNSSPEETRVIMVCSVLISETYVVPKQKYVRNQKFVGSSLIVPPGLADTTVSHNGLVHVKYNDNEFYPLYFVYYQRRPEQLIKSKFFHVNNHRMQPDQQILNILRGFECLQL